MAAQDVEFVADEGFYVQSALAWNHYGFYGDQYRYLWPPGYPFFLSQCFALSGANGLLIAKLLQILASGVTGAATMVFAHRLYGQRAATYAGILWIIYLPLIGFTHTLWSESLFLALFVPGVLQLLGALESLQRNQTVGRKEGRSIGRHLILAGLALAGAAYIKQAALFLIPLLGLLIAAYAGGSTKRRVWAASLFLLASLVPVLPWTLRNAEVYGRFVPVGATLGENVFRGINARYTNFDTLLVDAARKDRGLEPASPRERLVTPPGSGWERPEELPNLVERQQTALSRGVGFAREHPKWFVRSRLQKLADWVAPLSFFLRHQALGSYANTPLGGDAVRRATSIWALLCPFCVLALAVGGASKLDHRPAAALLGTVFAYFLATALLVSMSRFRIPVVPFCIVFAAGAFGRQAPARLLPTGLGIAALLFLWWLNLPVISGVLQAAWGTVA